MVARCEDDRWMSKKRLGGESGGEGEEDRREEESREEQRRVEERGRGGVGKRVEERRK